MTNTQKQKAVAELLGYDTNPAETDGVSIDYQGHWFDFDPATNPAQLIEVEDWLRANGCDWNIVENYTWFNSKGTIIGRGATRPTAAINAAAEIGGSDEK